MRRRAPNIATPPAWRRRTSSCLEHRAHRRRARRRTKVTLTGFVHVFSSGPDSNGVDGAGVRRRAGHRERLSTGSRPSARSSPRSTRRRSAPATPMPPRAARSRWPCGCMLPLVQRRARRPQRRSEVLPRQRLRAASAAIACAGSRATRSRTSRPTRRCVVARHRPDRHQRLGAGRRRSRSTSSCRPTDPACKSLTDTDCLDTERSAPTRRYQLNVSALSSGRLREHPGRLRACRAASARAKARSPARSTTATTSASPTSPVGDDVPAPTASPTSTATRS